MTKICFLTYYSYPEISGGAAIHAYSLAKHLAKNGFEVVVFSRKKAKGNDRASHNGIIIKKVGIPLFKWTRYSRVIDKNFIYPISVLKSLLDECYDADVLHIFSSAFFPIGYIIKKRLVHLQIITSITENIFSNNNSLLFNIFQKYQKWNFKQSLKYSDIVTFSNEYVLEMAKNQYPQFKNKMRLVLHFLETDIFSPNIVSKELRKKYNRKNIILTAGSLVENKGVATLIKAMKVVADEIPDVKLLIVGDGPMKSYLIRLTKKLQLQKHICFVSEVDHFKDMPNFYSISNIIVVPSRSESGQPPRSVAEPMAMEKPVIITDACDIKGVLSDAVIRLKVDDSNEFASLIINLLQNPKLCRELGKKGRKKILERYSSEEFYKFYNKIYDNLINNKLV